MIIFHLKKRSIITLFTPLLSHHSSSSHFLFLVCDSTLFFFSLILFLFMFSEFEEIPFVGMSNSELFLIEKDPKVIEFNILLRPTLEISDGVQIAGPGDQELHRRQEEEEEKDQKCREMASLGEFKLDDDDDGFRTPTSLDHKIPVIQKCPPAPRKPKSLPSTKRKASSNRRQLLFDVSDEMELLFPPTLLSDLGCKTKKFRSDSTEKSC